MPATQISHSRQSRHDGQAKEVDRHDGHGKEVDLPLAGGAPRPMAPRAGAPRRSRRRGIRRPDAELATDPPDQRGDDPAGSRRRQGRLEDRAGAATGQAPASDPGRRPGPASVPACGPARPLASRCRLAARRGPVRGWTRQRWTRGPGPERVEGRRRTCQTSPRRHWPKCDALRRRVPIAPPNLGCVPSRFARSEHPAQGRTVYEDVNACQPLGTTFL